VNQNLRAKEHLIRMCWTVSSVIVTVIYCLGYVPIIINVFSTVSNILGEKINLSSIVFCGDNMVSHHSQWSMVVAVS
jgi:energy-converting hydrogenase Eha subunit A